MNRLEGMKVVVKVSAERRTVFFEKYEETLSPRCEINTSFWTKNFIIGVRSLDLEFLHVIEDKNTFLWRRKRGIDRKKPVERVVRWFVGDSQIQPLEGRKNWLKLISLINSQCSGTMDSGTPNNSEDRMPEPELQKIKIQQYIVF